MRIGSLFSGAGGLDLAVREVFGGEVVWHSELDPAASKVLAHNWPGVPNLGDITQVDWSSVEPVEVLGGGFPCQDVSAAGKRAGIKAGTRSGLWALFADAIDALRPPIVVIENVRGLLSAEAHRDLEPRDTTMGDGPGRPVLRAAGAVLGDLADLGYDAQWCTVAASDIGAPHRRERVFILATDTAGNGQPRFDGRASSSASCGGRKRVAARSDGRGPEPVALLPTPAASRSGNNQSPSPGAAVRPSLDMITDLLPTPSCADGGGGHLTRSGDRGTELLLPGVARAYATGDLLLPTPKTTDYKINDSPGEVSRHSPALGAINHYLPTPAAADSNRGPDFARAGRDGSGGDDLHTFVARMSLLPTHAASDATGGGRHPDARAGHTSQIIDTALLHGTPQWGKYEPAIRRWEHLTRIAPSPTEPNKNGNPRLSAAFSEWLMGWPAGWVTLVPGISRNDQLRIVGNGVVPQQAVAALRWLLSVRAVAA